MVLGDAKQPHLLLTKVAAEGTEHLLGEPRESNNSIGQSQCRYTCTHTDRRMPMHTDTPISLIN